MSLAPATKAGHGALALLVLAFLLSVTPAEAHLVTTGLGPVYDGISHLLLSPADLVPIIALGFLGGQGGPIAARHVLFVLPGCWLVGSIAGYALSLSMSVNVIWLIFMLLGGLVAVDLKASVTAIATLAALVGAFEGLADGSGIASAPAGVVSLMSISAAVFIVTALASAAAIAFRWQPARIAVRVLGSWTAATGLLLLGWSLR